MVLPTRQSNLIKEGGIVEITAESRQSNILTEQHKSQLTEPEEIFVP